MIGRKDIVAEKNELSGQMISGMSWKFAERLCAQGVSFIVSIVLARILMPEDYGVVAIINVFMAIADVLLTSGLSSALIQRPKVNSRDFSTIFYCNFLLSCFIYILMFISAPFLAAYYNLPILKPAMRVFAIRLPISAFQTIQSAIISRNMEFKKFFFSTIGGTLISAVVGIGLALNGFGVWALIIQYLTNTCIDTIILALIVRWHPGLEFDVKHAKPLLSYGWRIMLTDFIGTVFNNLGDFVIGVKYTSSQLAFYSKGKQLPMLVRANIYTTLISVLFPAMSKVNSNIQELKALTRKSVSMLSYIIFPLMCGMIAVANNMTAVLYTKKWLPIVPFIYIVCIEAMISVLGTVTLQSIKAYGRSDIMLKMEFIKKPIMIASLLIAMRYGVYAIALTLPLNTILELFINGIVAKRLIGYNLKLQLFDCLSALLYSIIMGSVVFCIGFIKCNTLVVLVLQVVVGIFIYLLISLITRNPNFLIIKQFIKTKLNR